ncbi:hypothetical protein O181_006759 [Austropuccinia psidii MF-1]|uniref:Integrase catalytic domain-containing protein n=1 Tax=Austropuccinia psidii MF-1 TaxID=1389203 RepID=A0A9Q3BKM9_9BASI|nr:hypothetical protein [Austropuccinia psidii MF-1]
MSELPEKIPLFILDSNESTSLFITHYTKWVVNLPSFPSFEWDFFIIDSPKGEDLILGYDFLNHFNPIIYWKNGLITYDSNHKDSSGINSSTSNDLATAFNSVSLVGELKTPALPSSVHIPSIIPSQGFFFYTSLEEQRDEEEEPEELEAVLKVVPPAYNQYFDVFSKVKTEELPQHRACVHHIKLEGLLPPVTPKKITALTFLHKKDSPFIFNEESLSRFQILKEAFTTAPILSHFNTSLPTIVETDASDYALGSVLSQVNDSGKHPIAFDSCKLLPAELNYEIHDKKLLGIFWALKRWRAFLLSLSNTFEVLTDHSSLKYFMSSKVLTCCQAHWAELLVEFHFTTSYHPGRLATLPDALSCQDNVYPERGVDFISKNPQNFHQVIKQDGIQESRFFSIKVKIFSDLVDKIQKEVWQDKDYKEILNKLARGESALDYSLEPQSKLLLFKDRVVIPSNKEIQRSILQKCHDSPLASHPGQEKTLKLNKRDFYGASINQFIKDYVSSCQQCSRNKNTHHKKFGLLKPLLIISGPWNSLSMDFITQLPWSNNFNSILVVVDRFPKMPILIPTYGSITSLDLAQIIITHVFSKHGLPVSIVSDRGSLFFLSFWTNLCQQLKISRDLSTAFILKQMDRQRGYIRF